MAHIIGKTDDGKDIYGLDFDVSVKSVKESDDGKRVFSMTGSTPSVDRDGDTIDQKGWVTKHYKKSPVVQWAHDHKIPVIAKVNKFSVDGAALTFDEIEFPKEGIHPFADMIASLMEAGFIKAGSVGFLPIKTEKRELSDKEKENEPDHFCPPVNFKKQELLEFSICNVGSNRDSLVTHLGKKGFKTTGKVQIEGHEFEVKQLIDALFLSEKPEDEAVWDGPKEGDHFEGVVFEGFEVGKALTCADCDIKMDEEKSVEITKDMADKPFKNEHSCRLVSPDEFDSFRRQNDATRHEEKRIDFIFGIKEGKSKLQAMRYSKSIWTASSAKSHCASKDGSFEAAIKYVEISRNTESKALTLNINDSFGKFFGKEVRIAWKSESTERCFEANLQAFNEEEGKWFNVEAIAIEESQEKVGAVLSKTNKNKLKQSQGLIGEVLAASEPVETVTESESDNNSQPPDKDLKEIIDRISNMEKVIDDLAVSAKAPVIVQNDVTLQGEEVDVDSQKEVEIDIEEIPHEEKEIDIDEVEEETEEVDLKDIAQVTGDAIKSMAKEIIEIELRKVTGKID